MRQRAIGDWFQILPTGNLFHKDAASILRACVEVCDADAGHRTQSAVVTHPTGILEPHPSIPADTNEVTGRDGRLDASKPERLPDPRWGDSTP